MKRITVLFLLPLLPFFLTACGYNENAIVRQNIFSYVNENYAMLETFDYISNNSELAMEIQRYISNDIKDASELNVAIVVEEYGINFYCGRPSYFGRYLPKWSFYYTFDENKYIEKMECENISYFSYLRNKDGLYMWSEKNSRYYIQMKKIRDNFFFKESQP